LKYNHQITYQIFDFGSSPFTRWIYMFKYYMLASPRYFASETERNLSWH